MALPQLHTIFPATLCRNRSHTVSPVVTRGLAQRHILEDPEQMRTLAEQAAEELAAVQPGIEVVFLDTGYHFAETIGTRDAVEAVYPVKLINVTPSRTVKEQDAELGPRLFGRNPDLCCYLRKVEPLERALTNYDAWITGVRRDETSNRRQARVVEWDDRREMDKVDPIVSWTQEQVDAYIAEHGVVLNPLVDEG